VQLVCRVCVDMCSRCAELVLICAADVKSLGLTCSTGVRSLVLVCAELGVDIVEDVLVKWLNAPVTVPLVG
jgi:hypothetical protein